MSVNSSSTSDPRDRLEDAARRVFGWETLHPEQLDAMVPLLDGRDVLAVLATGYGKSAIYQIPSLLLPGVTVIVSPLIALQNDQIAFLDSTSAPKAMAINSKQRAAENEANWQAVSRHEAGYVFLSPEQLANDEVIERLGDVRVALMVVDEAHCVSVWGSDFRPDYLRLADALERLGRPPVAALTATASPPVRDDIVGALRLRDPVVVAGGFDRPNLDIAVHRHIEDAEKRRAVIDEVVSLEGPGIVYAATRKDTERYAESLAERGIRACAYHAGMPAQQRHDVHERFLDGTCEVVVATSAFGMGIDKPDVRFVVHASVPDSIDSYYQQIGRAGRDGERATVSMFYRTEDLSLATFFTTHSPDDDLISRVFAVVRASGPVRLGRIREELGDRGRRLANAANLLERAGVIVGGRRGFIAADLTARRALERARDAAEAGERFDRSRVEMMRGYAETRGCRRQFLLGYFGETIPDPCGTCDNCVAGVVPDLAPDAGSTIAGEPLSPETPVVHEHLGRGVVLSTQHDRVTVLFDTEGYRTLSLDVVDESGVLTVAEP